MPKKGGYDLSFLDQVEDLQNISPQAIAKIKTPVKASPKSNSPPAAKGNLIAELSFFFPRGSRRLD